MRSRFLRLFSGSDPERTIGELIAQAGTKMDLHERAVWFEEVLAFLKPRSDQASPDARIRYFFNSLSQNASAQAAFRDSVSALLRGCSFLRFFSQTGYTHEHGLWSEVAHRVLERLLPQTETDDFEDIIGHVFEEEEDFAWLETLPDAALAEFARLFRESTDEEIRKGIVADLREALLLQSVNLAHHGLSVAVRGRLQRRREIADSSFLRLSAALQRGEATAEQIARCRRDIEAVYRNVETSGVSVSTVHTLEALSAALDRVEALRSLRDDPGSPETARSVARFVAEIARASDRARSVRRHLGRHFYLLSRKIAERNGQSGEHYVARSRAELWTLFLSGLGGGAIVVGMTMAKVGVLHSGLAPFFSAFAVSIVYAIGFLAMQFTGATLATKIPSFTASRLAQWIADARSKNDTHEFTGEVGAVVRSQTLALLGNVITVVLCTLGIDLALKAVGIGPLFGAEYAHRTIADLHPLKGPAIFHGALTGSELWMSSLIGGWFENFVVFRGVPEGIVRHPRLRRIFGDVNAKTFAAFFMRHASGLGTNVSLGFLFGFVPLLGTLIGINLDGKHVTISTTGATFAFSSLGTAGAGGALAWTIAGLAIIGFLNFAVSFCLAIFVAARAQRVERAWAWHFFRSLWRTSPIPPRS